MSFAFRAKTRADVEHAMQAVIDELATRSFDYADPACPRRTGLLASTGYSEPGDDLTAEAGYRVAYAYWVHRRNPWFQHGIDSAGAELDSIVRDYRLT